MWPAVISTDLTCRIAQLSPRGLSRDPTDRLIASISTRYLFEIVANVSVMLNYDPPARRLELQDQWIKLRDMMVVPDGSYRMPLENLSDKTRSRLEKRKSFTYSAWPKYSRETQSEEFINSVAIGNQAFLFEDPWQLTMAKKAQYVPTSDKDVFLERWKMYSHISHASAFSIFPTWMYPVPIHDALQAISCLYSVICDFLSHEYDSGDFLKGAWSLIEEDQRHART